MQEFLKTYLLNIVFGQIAQHRGLTVLPIMASGGGKPAYLTMAEALEQNLIVVTEISQGGSVPELQVDNRADLPVLLLDGEELTGSKQNRVLNTTILLKERSLTVVPVSCTEQGRWSYVSPQFADSGNVMSPSVRHHKVRSVSDSLRKRRGHKSDQGRVWAELDSLSVRAGVNSPTGAMSDIFRAQQERLQNLTGQFPLAENQAGLLALDSQQVVGFDIVSSPKAFTRLYPKLLTSYAMDVITSGREKDHPSPIEAARQFLATAGSVSESVHESLGYGYDYRFVGPAVVGSALVVEPEVVHMAFFNSPSETMQNEQMSGPSRRRRFRSR